MRPVFVRTAGALALALATATAASAQATGTITGTVTSAANHQPLAGAQVYIPGTQLGMLSGQNGRFLILNVPAGQQKVQVQLLGYGTGSKTVTVTAGGSVSVNFELSSEAVQVEGLVVTALGVKKQQRSLGYAVQSVDSTRLQATPQLNVASALQGQAAGLSVMQSSSRPGAGTRITIRGEGSLTGGGQPLWVVDGVPISTTTDAQNGFGWQGSFALETGQAGSRAMDIDPNNIESISILRGAAATALYGSRAAYGAIIVTTKQGAPGQKATFTVTQRLEAQTPILEGKQNLYTAGQRGQYCNGLANNFGGWCEPGYYAAGYNTPTTYYAWGPRADSVSAAVLAQNGGPVKMTDPRSEVYKTGQTSETSISATGGITGGGSYNLSTTYANQSGIDPNDQLNRLNLNANVSLQLTHRLRSGTTIMFSNTDNRWISEGYSGIDRNLMITPSNVDLTKGWMCDGQAVASDACGHNTPVMFGTNSPSIQWVAANEYYTSHTGRWVASQMLAYNLGSGLTLQNRLGLDTYEDQRGAIQHERPWRTTAGQTSGGNVDQKYNRQEINNDLTLNLDNRALGHGVTLSGLLGNNINMRSNNQLLATCTTISIPGYYNCENFENQVIGETLVEKRRLVGVYGQATVDYNDWAFLNLTGRNDWSSTLPTSNNSYFYPSASLGVVFTDALGWHSKWLDYGKIRFSWAKVGTDAPPYSLSTTYYTPGPSNNHVTWPFRNQLGFLQSTSLGNPNIKPETTRELELGLDLRGLQGRMRLQASLYKKKSYDQIFSVPSAAETGYESITRNAGDLTNKGIELTLHAVPVQTPKFRWDMNANWSMNRSMVDRLAPGVTSIYLAGYSWPQIRIMAGVPYGVIWGYGFKRLHSDPTDPKYKPLPKDQGPVLIGDNGLPEWDDQLKVIGTTQPDWTGNLYNAFSYGPFTLSGLVTMSRGGQVLDFDLNYTVYQGTAGVTANRGTWYTYKGIVASTGQPNTQKVLRDQAYYQNELGGYDHHEYQVKSGSYVRLQDLQLTYRVPRSILDPMGLNSLQLYVEGSNLWIGSSYPTGDPMGSNYGAENAGGAYFHFFLAPPVRTYSIGLRTSF